MMLDGDDGIAVVGEASDGDEVPAAADRHAPDLVLMDLRMPRVNGIIATRRLRSRPHPPEVVVLTAFDTDENVLRAQGGGQRIPAQGLPARPDHRGDPPGGGR
jgi:DNA-binding NarL/FixJ family response regulator